MYAQICSWDNLWLAFQKASRGKRSRPAAAAFEHRLEDNLLDLQADLLNFTYTPGPYDSFYIHEPKRRLISAAPFRDRVVHHVLCNLIEPIFERSFIFDSYANRVGKGTHRALNRAQQYARRYPYVLQCDIRQYFPCIDHAILQNILAQKLKDPAVLWLCSRIIASGASVLSETPEQVYYPQDDLFAALRPRGLPIGNLTSQFWANVYLNGFDHFVKQTLRCPAYIRYVDDFLLFAHTKAALWQYRSALQQRLAQLRLSIHAGAHPFPVTEGLPFLGFIIHPAWRRLKRRKGLYFCRQYRRKQQQYQQGLIALSTLTASAQGWINHLRYANTTGLRQAVFQTPIPPPNRQTLPPTA
ncbi:MAG TPA: reverse transcriptase domain-containing protein [Anaerolineaceae bacterium]|nr:reverse transcriptase domain-containing protein [Anaerolineaceae bacterium]HOG79815.1 reverse transcriptase domain-containing protein [Anaerolineaceae bacterium]